MTVSRACYCNRYEVQSALDFRPGVDVNGATDRAMMSAAEDIEGSLKRVFYPSDHTVFFDWPSQGTTQGGVYADPWKLPLGENDLVCPTQLVSGGVTIPLNQVFVYPFENPAKHRPYYWQLELDRSFSVQFGNNAQTPQYAIGATGTWGYGADADPAGSLAAEVASAGAMTVTVSDGALCGPGDVIILGYGRGEPPFPGSQPHAGSIAPFLGERLLVADVAAADTGLAQSGPGCSTASDSDNALSVTGAGSLNAGEVVVLDQEQMLVQQVVNGVAAVRRAWAGTALQPHSDAEVFAFRQLSVVRSVLGSVYSGPYDSGAAVVRHRVPELVRDLAIGLAGVQLVSEGTAYARTMASGDAAAPAPGAGLGWKWKAAMTRHGRGGKARHRGV